MNNREAGWHAAVTTLTWDYVQMSSSVARKVGLSQEDVNRHDILFYNENRRMPSCLVIKTSFRCSSSSFISFSLRKEGAQFCLRLPHLFSPPTFVSFPLGCPLFPSFMLLSFVFACMSLIIHPVFVHLPNVLRTYMQHLHLKPPMHTYHKILCCSLAV